MPACHVTINGGEARAASDRSTDRLHRGGGGGGVRNRASHMMEGSSRGLVVKVLDSKFKGCEFKTHTGHGSFSKLRQFRLPHFASVYSAANEYKHCLEGTCDGLVSRPGESV